ncbi:MAG: hypothetical protein ACKO63_05915 [Nodosilinea sp.]
MGPDDSNFPEEIPAIPEAGQLVPDPSPPQPTAAAPGDEMASEPEAWNEVDRATVQPDPGEAAAHPDLGAEPPPPTPAPAESAPESAPESANWVEAELPYQPKPLSTLDELLIGLAEGVSLWRRGLRWLRSQLPVAWRSQLSDQLLTAILLGFGVVLLVVTHPLDGRVTSASGVASPNPVAEVAAPLEPTLELEPTPTLEESLITDLQTQLSGMSRSYSVGLIDAVEVNLPHQALTIHLGESWYGLLATQQDSIAQAIYRQAQDLGLERLSLQDPQGLVVARSPVVGSTVVVLQRRPSGTDLTPV